MKLKSLSFIFILTILFALILTACGNAAAPASEQLAEAPVEAPAVEAPAEAFDASGAAEGKAVEAERVVEAPAEEALPVEQMGSAPANPVPGMGGQADILPADAGRMVIKDAIMALLVQDTNRAIDEVTNLASTQGGYIINSNSWFDDDLKYAQIKMAVPSANFERTLVILRALGIKVLSENASGQDVSADYNDLQVRLDNLEATAARVRAFLDEAKTVEESLRINSTLTQLEGEINQVKGQMKFYEGRSAYSTIDVSLNPLAPTPTVTPTPTITPTPTPTATPTPWNPGLTISQASRRSVGLWQDIVEGLIWFCFMTWPLILVGGLIILLVWWLRRRKKAKTTPPPPPPAE